MSLEAAGVAWQQRLGQLLSEWMGVDPSRGGQRERLERFVAQRVQALHLPCAEAYVNRLKGRDHPEAIRLINALTVGHTWFFRDPEQMDLIAKILREDYPRGHVPQIWVPGCSTGEDVYTLAFLAHRAGRLVSVLASDINTEALRHAGAARYDTWSLRELPDSFRDYLVPTAGDLLEVAPALRQRVRFRHHSLVDPPPMPERGGAWDIILCRNVLIYFGKAQAQAAVDRLGRSLAPSGWLFLGASEVLRAVPQNLQVNYLGGRYGLQQRVLHPR